MAEETKPSTPAAAPPATEVVAAVVTEAVVAVTPPPSVVVEPTKTIEEVVTVVAAAAVEVETEKPKEEEEVEGAEIAQSVSFKEESNIVADLEDPEKKALDEFKQLVQQALNNHEFTAPPPPPKSEEPKPEVEEEKPAEEEEKKPEVEEEEKKPEVVEEEKKSISEATSSSSVEITLKEAEPALVPEPVKEVEKVEEKKEEKKEEEKVEEKKVEEKVEEKKEEEKVEEKKEEEKVEEKKEEEKVEEKKEEEEKVEEEKKEEKKKSSSSSVVAEVFAAVAAVFHKDSSKSKEPVEASSVPIPEPIVPIIEETIEKVIVIEEEVPPPIPEEVSIYGVPLLADERSDTILLKFLRARDFKVKEAFTMLKNVVLWRKEFGIDALIDEDLGSTDELDKVVFTKGFDKEGHPICYNVFGELNSYSDVEKGQKFLKWRIQFLEKSIRNLDFTPGGISTIVQVNDLKNFPGIFKRELRVAINLALTLLQDNYPEFVAKQIFINVPWWFLAVNRMISPFLTQRTKSKFVYAGPSKSAETLFKYIAPEQVPVQFGGLYKEGEQEFCTEDAVTDITIKPATKQTIELPVTEVSTLTWELRVIGWEVSYGAEFVPDAEDGYTVIVSKTRKLIPTDEPVLTSSFKIGEPGKVVLTIDNPTSKKKKLLYRSKIKSSSD